MRILAPSALFAATLLSACGGGNDACRCDIIAAESKCIEYRAPDNPLYATQLATTCSTTLEGLCSTLGGAYEMGASCTDDDRVATCTIDNFSYVVEETWYSSGSSPFTADSPDPDEDCSEAGVVTRY